MKRSPLKRGRQAPRKRAPDELTPSEWREAVWRLCEGHCIASGRLVSLDDPTWDCHHAIKAQTLRKRKISTTIPEVGVVVDSRAHEAHTNRSKVIDFGCLPPYVVEFAASLGPWAEDALLREHPRQDPH